MSDGQSKESTVEENKSFDVFVSYARADAAFAEHLVQMLEQRGVSCWLDRNIVAGSRWEDQIRDAIQRCRYFVIVVSRSTASSSPFVSAEWCKIQESVWQRQDSRIFPITVGPVETPPFLSQWHAFRLDKSTASIKEIAEAIAQRFSEAKPENDLQEATPATVERFQEIERAVAALHSGAKSSDE